MKIMKAIWAGILALLGSGSAEREESRRQMAAELEREVQKRQNVINLAGRRRMKR